MTDEIIKKIQYAKKKDITLTKDNISCEARKIIECAKDEDVLALRIRINSPVFIEAAAPLTIEGIKEVCKNQN